MLGIGNGDVITFLSCSTRNKTGKYGFQNSDGKLLLP